MILITGATGNNGKELIRQLTAMGQGVRAFVRNPAEASRLKGPNIELAVGDFDQPETLDAALRGVEKASLIELTGRGRRAYKPAPRHGRDGALSPDRPRRVSCRCLTLLVCKKGCVGGGIGFRSLLPQLRVFLVGLSTVSGAAFWV